MPITIKQGLMKYKNGQNEYIGINTVGETSSAQQIANINQAGATQVAAVNAAGSTQASAINTKGQEVLESIPSDYTALGDEVSELKDAITDKADVIISSASGSIASFSDGADDLPVKELTVGIEPVQDLHGYENPWPAGGGKNKINIPDTVLSSAAYLFNGDISLPSGSYVFSITKDDGVTFTGDVSVAVVMSDGNNATKSSSVSGNRIVISITASESIVAMRVYAVAGTYSKMQLESGTTATEWTPYSNICPITGWTGCTILHTGKNLLDPDEIALANNDAYVWVARGTGIKLRKGYTYTFSMGSLHSATLRLMTLSETTITNAGNAKYVTYTPDDDEYVVFRISDTTTYSLSEVKGYLQLELGSVATAYEPYQGETYDITFPTEAGTVYGGTLNPVTGELVVDRMMVQIRAAQNKNTDANDNYFWYSTSTNLGIPNIKELNAKLISNRMTKVTNTTIIDPDGSITFYANGIIRWKEQGALTLSEYNSYLSDNPLEICYEINNPTTYTLTPTEIRTLLGENHIWADAGDVAVTYNADTKTYVDSKEPEVPVKDVQVNGVSVLDDGVANVPIMGGNTFGVAKLGVTDGSYGLSTTIPGYVGQLLIEPANDNHIKAGSGTRRPLSSAKAHVAAFYGLAKAAGDTTQSTSSNAVGTYTDEAKQKIQKMLGVGDWFKLWEDTTSEAVATYTISTDGNGNPFVIRDAIIYITAAAGSQQAVYLTLTNSDNLPFQVNLGNIVNTGVVRTVIRCERIADSWNIMLNTPMNNYRDIDKSNMQMYCGLISPAGSTNISKIELKATSFPAGTKVVVYGKQE